MKNSQRGFIVPLLLVIIVVLLVGGGAYVYTKQKQDNQTAAPNLSEQTNSATQAQKPSTTFPSITITSPAGGETFQAGGPITVSFPGVRSVGKYKVELFSTLMAGDYNVYNLGTINVQVADNKNVFTISTDVKTGSVPIKGGSVDIGKSYRIRITQLTNNGSSCTNWDNWNVNYCAQAESNYFTITP